MTEDVSAYMRVYVADLIAATVHLNAEERGAYGWLLFHMWKNHGWLVLDHNQMASICGVERRRWPRVWSAISGFFIVNEEVKTFTQKRLQEELESAVKGRKKRSDAGKRGADATWSRHGNAIPPSMALPSTNDSNAMPSADGNALPVIRYPLSDNRQEGPAGARVRVAGDVPPVDPTTPSGILSVLRAAVEREHSELGFYDPGPFAEKDAAEFCARLPEPREQHGDLIRSRADAFAKDDAFRKDGWVARRFFQSFNALGAGAGTRTPTQTHPWSRAAVVAHLREKYKDAT